MFLVRFGRSFLCSAIESYFVKSIVHEPNIPISVSTEFTSNECCLSQDAKASSAETASALFIYAGSMQIVMVPMMTSGASLIAIAIMTFFINARHLFYGIGFIEQFRSMGWKKPYMILTLTDETYSLLCSVHYDPELDKDKAAFLISFLDHMYWITGGVLGNMIGSVLPFSTNGIEFSMTAIFVASFTEQWMTNKDHFPALVGLITSAMCLYVFGIDIFLIPAMIIITIILLIFRKKEEKTC